jgi:purine-cytosine permease-like protein
MLGRPHETIASRLDKLYEFERAPVTPDQLKRGGYFAALFAGEHVAGTEFVIGAMFAAWGATAKDLILGLLLGNALAVLSWAFLCAPIGIRTRLTLYWYLRRIAGPGLTVIYNIINAMMYCILAGSMIAVCASAVSLGFNIKHPQLSDVLPNSVGWVVVLGVGLAVVVLAILGFKKMSQFSAVCSPWMFLIFFAGALATLPKLGEIHSLSDFWILADTRIWKGVAPAGQERLGFWHIMFFAWFCNLAMHVGLSDMALFRYARRWTYGFYSAFGMYLGHYLAWVCAGIMGAWVVGNVEPGTMASKAAGLAGLIAVILAGWTTANPTLYRAGLALQIATPNWPRWAVTLVAGIITTFVACFPVVFMQLLNFVAIYGLVLMPIGAIVFTEHWLFPKLGLRRYWAEKRGSLFNLPALITWVVVLILAFPIEKFTGGSVNSPMSQWNIHLFFRWLPGWFISAILYLLLCYVWPGARGPSEVQPAAAEAAAPPPKTAQGPTPKLGPVAWAAGAVALGALAATFLLPLTVFLVGGSDPAVYEANMEWYKQWLLVATIVYFVAGTTWYAQREKVRSAQGTAG